MLLTPFAIHSRGRLCSMLLVLISLLLTAPAFAQAQKNPKKSAAAGQSAQHSTTEQPGAAKPETAPGASAAEEEEQDDQKGPWHGLRWRSVGPFRGGRVLAVSGV